MYLLGICLVQLFADLLKVCANQYLRHVDSDKLLICESYAVAQNTADLLADIDNIATPKADAVTNNFAVDQFSNITLEIEINDSIHKLMLNTKVTRNFGLDQIKRSLLKCKTEILNCMVENIREQNDKSSLAAMMDAFNLQSTEDLDSRTSKVELLHDLSGQNITHTMQKW